MPRYIKTGKVQYMFVDYPIAQLHPTAARAHEAANCAAEQGKYWELHRGLFSESGGERRCEPAGRRKERRRRRRAAAVVPHERQVHRAPFRRASSGWRTSASRAPP